MANAYLFNRGDMVHAYAMRQSSRQADPQRLLLAYRYEKQVYQDLQKRSASFSISHECILLEYEIALTRCLNNVYYNLSIHYPWLGMRTLNSIWHQRYLAHIENPIALKIGPDVVIKQLINCIQLCNPLNQPGRITLITRLGHAVHQVLGPLLDSMKAHQLKVIWLCDPMRTNTHFDRNGMKYRLMSDMMQEIQDTVHVHQAHQSYLAGLQLECSPDDQLQECIQDLNDLGPWRCYKSLLDPRLNRQQSQIVIDYFLQSIV